MSDEILKVIERWQSDERLASFDEARVKQAIILAILRGLGWDMDNPDELWPEYALGGGRVDYALLIGNTAQVFIEAKNGSERLEEHEEQLLGYAFKQGVKIAILTNGTTWWFYLPLQEGSWKQRKFDTVELDKQDKRQITQKLVDFLGKENISSGKAVQNAEILYKKRQILTTLPEAWNQLVSEPEGLIIDLLAEKTGELCGYEPEEKEVKQFLLTHLQNIKIKQPPMVVGPVLPGSMKGKKPTAFTFKGTRYNEVKSWREMLVQLCEIAYITDRDRFEKVLSLRGKKSPYFSKNSNDLRESKMIKETGIYVEINQSADSTVKLARELISLFGHGEKDLSFEIE